jgi:hypothetical protein
MGVEPHLGGRQTGAVNFTARSKGRYVETYTLL